MSKACGNCGDIGDGPHQTCCLMYTAVDPEDEKEYGRWLRAMKDAGFSAPMAGLVPRDYLRLYAEWVRAKTLAEVREFCTE